MYYLKMFDGNINWFLGYFKNYIYNLCKQIHDIIYCFFFICLFESEKRLKEGEKIKIWISRERKGFLDVIKSIFL